MPESPAMMLITYLRSVYGVQVSAGELDYTRTRRIEDYLVSMSGLDC